MRDSHHPKHQGFLVPSASVVRRKVSQDKKMITDIKPKHLYPQRCMKFHFKREIILLLQKSLTYPCNKTAFHREWEHKQEGEEGTRLQDFQHGAICKMKLRNIPSTNNFARG